MSAPATDLIGRTLAGGRYRVLAKLGEGGMGAVYRARDRNLNADVVIKAPRRALLVDPEFAARFAGEIRALVRLAHPHIVKVSDVGDDEGLPFAVMQYLPGGTLEDRRERGPGGRPLPIAPSSLAGWLPAVAEALDFVHARGFIHRDVKPGNVFFDGQGHAYLGDFGIAKALTASTGQDGPALTGTGMVLGTPEYLAPELIMGDPADGRADQYALAVSLYELLSGRRPFEAVTPSAVLVQQTTRQPPPLHAACPAVGAALSAVVHRGLAKDPARRYPTCSAYARAVLDAAAAPAAEPATIPVAPEVRKVLCPACRAPLAIPAGSQGRKFRCPACSARYQIAADEAGVIPLDSSGWSTEVYTVPTPMPADRAPRTPTRLATTIRAEGSTRPESVIESGPGWGAWRRDGVDDDPVGDGPAPRAAWRRGALVAGCVAASIAVLLGGYFALKAPATPVDSATPARGIAAAPIARPAVNRPGSTPDPPRTSAKPRIESADIHPPVKGQDFTEAAASPSRPAREVVADERPEPAPEPRKEETPAAVLRSTAENPLVLTVEEAFTDRGELEGEFIQPRGAFTIGTKVAASPEKFATIALLGPDGRRLAEPGAGLASTRLNFVLNVDVAKGLDRSVRFGKVQSAFPPTYRAALTFRVRRVPDATAWLAEIMAIELLVETDFVAVQGRELGSAFQVVRIDADGNEPPAAGDGDAWIERLGGDKYLTYVRRKYQDALSQIRREMAKARGAALAQQFGANANALGSQERANINARVQSIMGGR